jgi:hypothetical protein
MYAVSANEMRYAVNGVDRMRWQAGGLPTQTYNVATGLWEDLEPVGVVGPNLLDNSNFQIAQRGTGAIAITSAGAVAVDRWSTTLPTNTTHRQSSNGVSKYLVMERAGTYSQIMAGQPIRFDERSRLPFVAGATFTLSWEMYCAEPTGAGCRVSFAKDWVVANFENIYAKAAIQDVPVGQWTRITQTFTLASDVVDVNMDRVLVEVGAWDGSFPVSPDEPVRIRNIKLEEGNTFTGYEPTPYAIDEAECKRWFLKSYSREYLLGTDCRVITGGYGGAQYDRWPTNSQVPAVANRMMTINFDVEMVSAPNITTYSLAGTIGGCSDCGFDWDHDVNIIGTSTAKKIGTKGFGGIALGTITDATIGFHYSASCEL